MASFDCLMPICAEQRFSNKSKPTLFIEIKLHDDSKDDGYLNIDQIKAQVERWLPQTYRSIKVGQTLENMNNLPCRNFIRSCKVSGHSSIEASDANHIIADNNIEIAIYSLYTVDDCGLLNEEDGDLPSLCSILTLPHKDFDGQWESLIYDEPLPERILRIVTRMMCILRGSHLNPSTVAWLNLILLFGSPGTGKTTLAKALAQKLSIRMADVYPITKYLEVNSHTLLSKWFGESSKLVGQLFEDVLTLSSDPSLLVVVLIDEVETLAGSREKASSGNECGDVLRSTNELLQGLDKLYNRPNVVVVCTSNLKDSLDPAFLDRCRVKKHLENPNVDCIYNILRSSINELINMGLVSFDFCEDEIETVGDRADGGISCSHLLSYPSTSSCLREVPDLDWVIGNLSHLSYDDGPQTSPMLLRALSQSAIGLDSRTLRALPISALVEYTVDEPCNFQELLVALERKLKEERAIEVGSDTEIDRKSPLKDGSTVKIDNAS